MKQQEEEAVTFVTSQMDQDYCPPVTQQQLGLFPDFYLCVGCLGRCTCTKTEKQLSQSVEVSSAAEADQPVLMASAAVDAMLTIDRQLGDTL